VIVNGNCNSNIGRCMGRCNSMGRFKGRCNSMSRCKGRCNSMGRCKGRCNSIGRVDVIVWVVIVWVGVMVWVDEIVK
jgi:hypothetical protein